MRPHFIVGIGGSAGALNAYTALLDTLPSDTGMALVFVYHVHPTAQTHLVEILSRHTHMPVLFASTAVRIQANHVYVLVQNTDLRIEHDAFNALSPSRRRGKQIDFFFISLAEALEARAIGVILSGYHRDGTEGCKHIKTKGGTTFAQDVSAEVGDMPLSAQAAGCIDFVLSPQAIARALSRISRRVVG